MTRGSSRSAGRVGSQPLSDGRSCLTPSSVCRKSEKLAFVGLQKLSDVLISLSEKYEASLCRIAEVVSLPEEPADDILYRPKNDSQQ